MALFEKGHKLATGRPKDSLSKRSLKFADALMDSGVDIVGELLGALNNAKLMYETTTKEETRIAANAQIITVAEKMLPYMFPKLSSLEVKQGDEFAHLSPQEKLDRIKKVIPILENQVNQIEEPKDEKQDGE